MFHLSTKRQIPYSAPLTCTFLIYYNISSHHFRFRSQSPRGGLLSTKIIPRNSSFSEPQLVPSVINFHHPASFITIIIFTFATMGKTSQTSRSGSLSYIWGGNSSNNVTGSWHVKFSPVRGRPQNSSHFFRFNMYIYELFGYLLDGNNLPTHFLQMVPLVFCSVQFFSWRTFVLFCFG